jgi:hypothetical protein
VKDVILIFSSVHHTLGAEEQLMKTTWHFLVVPVPPHINEGCGLGIQIEENEVVAVLQYLEEKGFSPVKVVNL